MLPCSEQKRPEKTQPLSTLYLLFRVWASDQMTILMNFEINSDATDARSKKCRRKRYCAVDTFIWMDFLNKRSIWCMCNIQDNIGIFISKRPHNMFFRIILLSISFFNSYTVSAVKICAHQSLWLKEKLLVSMKLEKKMLVEWNWTKNAIICSWAFFF